MYRTSHGCPSPCHTAANLHMGPSTMCIYIYRYRYRFTHVTLPNCSASPRRNCCRISDTGTPRIIAGAASGRAGHKTVVSLMILLGSTLFIAWWWFLVVEDKGYPPVKTFRMGNVFKTCWNMGISQNGRCSNICLIWGYVWASPFWDISTCLSKRYETKFICPTLIFFHIMIIEFWDANRRLLHGICTSAALAAGR